MSDAALFIPFYTGYGSKITKLAFKNRWPNAKWRAAKALVSSNADIADFFESYDLATYIDLALPETQGAIAEFASNAVPANVELTAAEAASIVAYPITNTAELPAEVRTQYGLSAVPM